MGFLNKTGKTNITVTHVILILAAAYILNLGGLQDKFPIGGGAQEPEGDGDGGAGGVASLCPTDGDSTLKLEVRNALNSTGTETYDTTVYVFDSAGSIVATLTDTTAPSGTAINCDDTYTLKMIRADADNGDNSAFRGLDYGEATFDATAKTISFKAEKSTIAIGAKGSQHGLLKFKLFDNDNAAWVFDNADTSATNYENAGTTWNSTTDGSLGITLDTTATILNLEYKVSGNSTDTDFADMYTLVAVEAPVGEYNAPTVTWDGAILSDIKTGGLNSEESTQLSRYEYVYKIDGAIEDTIHTLGFQMTNLAGVDPSTDVEVDFYSAGAYLSVNGNTVKKGTAIDDSAKTSTFTVQDTTIQII